MLKQLIREVSQESNNNVIEQVEDIIYQDVNLEESIEIDQDIKDVNEAMEVINELDGITEQQGIEIQVLEEKEEHPDSRISSDPRVQDVDIILNQDNLAMENFAGRFSFESREKFYKYLSSNKALETLNSNFNKMTSLQKLKITQEGFLDVTKSLLDSAFKTIADVWKKIWEFIKNFFKNREADKLIKNLEVLTKGFISLRRKTIDDATVELMFPEKGEGSSFIEWLLISEYFDKVIENWYSTIRAVNDVMLDFAENYLDKESASYVITQSQFRPDIVVFKNIINGGVCEGFDNVTTELNSAFSQIDEIRLQDKKQKTDQRYNILGLSSDAVIAFNLDRMQSSSNKNTIKNDLGLIERIDVRDVNLVLTSNRPRGADLLNNIIANIDFFKFYVKKYNDIKDEVEHVEKSIKERLDILSREPFGQQENMVKFFMLLKQTIIMNISSIIRTPKTVVDTYLKIGKKINNVYKD